MTFNSEGAEVERLDKVRSLCCYPPAYKYLNVCFNELHNCGICATMPCAAATPTMPQ